ncbi:MAG: sigma-54 dependent transcriptional regulator [Candidatus Thiodiazotropha sp. (ex Ctena orbiculata)]|uniref:Sigma-54 dependent transcriptional regulator n=1 Tax=Candidatus Thiodiazotropha taylori TaxID=2792791 RepID=A0A944MEM8_9GAMM|nr:sigma-54 dependent transcriptional regulator [Candidatus Thiodiazotropha taylori]MBT2991269.1 sigma-54 dependent transcriptional regulator [Candidatus Thiodiazotropha taylori]MBT2996049.1 sigma-54 dependent transcriptional regulator [Candidatus Thiodiazotropha taylori]MBT3001583.1 sigma-54 dependent transcriptional regulator [Candidatus Thiodiazotropha taylori]MBT3025867.1 sigma-54 dependent transcriptional regulator [Candidatus Thiodiazotropha taylori]
MSQPTALIVDDEPDICELLEITLLRMGIDAHSVFDLTAAHKILSEQKFDLCLSDMRLPDGNGIDLVRHINETYPQLPVAMITAHGNMESAIEALKAGAFDFVSKPVDLEVLRKLVQQAIKLGKQKTEPTPEKETATADSSPMLGNSPPMKRVRELIKKLARSQAPVYISGESGTGKELAARLIHQQGPRADHPFVAVNCGAIPQELMESELFGHKKGSFTGATSDHQGLFLSADGGTLFLDEIADLPLHMQVKLLRAIQEKQVRPVGGQQEIPVDVRIISATHKNLAELVEGGDFRQDLFYRINVIELPLPPLRERSEDIPLLAQHFITRMARESGTKKSRLSSSALKKLKAYHFPGNIRELENILERSFTLLDGSELLADDLHLPANQQTKHTQDTASDQPLGDKMEQVEREAIIQALEETRWNRTAAAKKLGMTLRSLRYRLEKFGIE